jgi:hypothetical protein
VPNLRQQEVPQGGLARKCLHKQQLARTSRVELQMKTILVNLALDAVADLGQKVMALHDDIEKWREPKFTDIQRTAMTVQLKQALEKQNEWLRAIRDYLEQHGDDDVPH